MGINNVGVLKGDDDDSIKGKGRHVELSEQEWAQLAYPNHSPEAALANYKAGREVYDTNGDLW